MLKKGESILPGYKRIPYHMIFYVKFDGRYKCRLVAGGHRTPDVPPEEVYSGVVSMDTIRMVFVLSAMNNLDVCAADISTSYVRLLGGNRCVPALYLTAHIFGFAPF